MTNTEERTITNTATATATATATVAATVAATCPQCQREMYRIRRKFNQRLFFGSKRFYCETCHQTFLKWITLVKDN